MAEEELGEVIGKSIATGVRVRLTLGGTPEELVGTIHSLRTSSDGPYLVITLPGSKIRHAYLGEITSIQLDV